MRFGSAETTEENPFHTYTAVGTYDVSLYVTDNVTNEVDSVVAQAYIDCIDPFTGISGEVCGHWKPQYGDYVIDGSVSISEGNGLIIDPGTLLIYFNYGTDIDVNGSITISGNDGDEVVLAGNPDTNGLWNGIRITSNDPLNIISNCVFSGFRNTAVSLSSASVSISECTFKDGNVTTSAPGIFKIIGCNNLTFSDLYVYRNSIADGAGFAYLNNSSNIVFDKVVMANNEISQSELITSQASTIDLTNSLVVNNEGRNRLFYLISTSYLNVVNCTVANNTLTSPVDMKGIFFPYDGTLDMTNCIVDNPGENEIYIMSSPIVNVTYTAIRGGYAGTGNIDTENNDPLFTDPSEGSGLDYVGLSNWTLQTGSPCIDAGNPDASYNDIEDPQNSGMALAPALGTVTNDMGAYGFNGCLPTENVLVANDDNFIPQAKDFKVSQDIYPNPFNPTTNIELNIGKTPENVKLHVYNIRGQLVKTLVNNEVMSGTKNITWDGTDNNNSPVSTGVYFSNLNVGNKTSTKKMVLLK